MKIRSLAHPVEHTDVCTKYMNILGRAGYRYRCHIKTHIFETRCGVDFTSPNSYTIRLIGGKLKHFYSICCFTNADHLTGWANMDL